ncbi:GNAT family N-acetyltransferase [Sanguibacter sp. Z1732]|uniref:GNAT family N-acetyltransferase n=1 Tax=Sanguibacter sp. Z1732 TaxID=3435412 RepID=UPI003D9CAFE7
MGFISVGDPREDEAPAPRQVWALNLLPEHHGTGLAQEMMRRGLGDREAYLWVARGNDRAVAFYRRQGFTTDGASRERRDGMTEVRMLRRPAG